MKRGGKGTTPVKQRYLMSAQHMRWKCIFPGADDKLLRVAKANRGGKEKRDGVSMSLEHVVLK